MPRRHRDNSTRLNLERSLSSGRGKKASEFPSLEREADRAGMVHTRHLKEDNQYLAGYGHSGKGPKGYRRSDERIKEDVCDVLFKNDDVDASEIEVEVKDACVYLRGEVEDRFMKRTAEEAVENVSGVLDVQNELHFHKGSSTKERDFSPRELS